MHKLNDFFFIRVDVNVVKFPFVRFISAKYIGKYVNLFQRISILHQPYFDNIRYISFKESKQI